MSFKRIPPPSRPSFWMKQFPPFRCKWALSIHTQWNKLNYSIQCINTHFLLHIITLYTQLSKTLYFNLLLMQLCYVTETVCVLIYAASIHFLSPIEDVAPHSPGSLLKGTLALVSILIIMMCCQVSLHLSSASFIICIQSTDASHMWLKNFHLHFLVFFFYLLPAHTVNVS